ncbi:AtpZ/AtpI family protein [Ancylobacter sp. 6x-1]|uniref:ATP synthase protein I n=1 Tax=Ancylobacter crimeensis TaxID=2579147 RepID=A0ABT0D7P6_9HYPH|nr:AtpZ/AtpI family protein [Ancylobacter crimeensis]MCK0195972.1 AtpZ/AtpI family protein [Ancylobacter crimeensis]
MDDRDKTDGQSGARRPGPDDSALEGRLRGLGTALDKVQAERRVEEKLAQPDRTSTSAGLTLAFRLGSEFVAGVLVGAGLGWVVDQFFGTGPWGMIVFLLLGFGAAVLNMLRAAGETGRK